jgi:hypothetical protein
MLKASSYLTKNHTASPLESLFHPVSGKIVCLFSGITKNKNPLCGKKIQRFVHVQVCVFKLLFKSLLDRVNSYY